MAKPKDPTCPNCGESIHEGECDIMDLIPHQNGILKKHVDRQVFENQKSPR